MARVAVVGAGFGGLAAAIRLAAAGHSVHLIERTERLGGKASRVEKDGYSFDTGPSLLTMPDVVDDLFAAAGENRADHIELLRLPIQCRYMFPGGAVIDFEDDPAQTVRNIARVLPGQEVLFRQFLNRAGHMYEVTGRPYLDHPYEGAAGFARRMLSHPWDSFVYGVLDGSLGRTARTRLGHAWLRWIVERYATYAGGGPARSKATLAMILHIETQLGAWYPRGGIHALVDALEALALRRGVVVRRGTDVEQITVESGRVTGLRIAGRQEAFDAVVSNADPLFVGRQLLDAEVSRRAGLWNDTTPELGTSGVVLLLGIRGRLDHLAHHTIVFPERYEDEFRDLFDRADVPDDPTIYLCIPSRTDPSRAPDGCESVFCMINAPATSTGDAWTRRRAEISERLISRLERGPIPDIRQRIAVQEWVGPDELRTRYNAPGGSIYGASCHGFWSPFHRPQGRVRGIRGLYFAGGGTHPGGGIPLVMRSGEFAARWLESDVQSGRVPSSAAIRRVA